MREAIAATVAFFLCAALAYGLRQVVEPVRLDENPPDPPGAPEAPADGVEPRAPPPETRPLGDEPGLESVLVRLPALEREPAAAPIRGRVLLAEDSPLAGATIVARLVAPERPGVALEDRVREWVEEERASRVGGIAATTDAGGWFEIGGLVHADYRLEASHPDARIVPEWPGTGRHRPGDHVTFLATRGHPFELEVYVVGPGAGSPDEATIAIAGASSADRAVLQADAELGPAPSIPGLPRSYSSDEPEPFPASRSFRWSPSNRRLTVAWDGELVAWAPGGAVSERVAVSLSSPRSSLTLRLAAQRGIVLDVRLPEGSEKIVSRAAVMRIDPERPPTLERFARGAKWLGSSIFPSAIQGVVREGGPVVPLITDIPPGTYEVGVTLSRPDRRTSHFYSGPGEPPRGGRVDGWTTVDVSTGLATARVEVAAPSDEGRILVRVEGPDGRLLEGVEFVLWRTDVKATSPRREHVDWDRRADGSYLVGPPSEAAAAVLSGAETGSLELAATDVKLGEARGAVRPGSPASAEISFRQPGKIEVVVTGTSEPRLIERVRIELRRSSAPGSSPERIGSRSIDGTSITHDRIPPTDYLARVVFSCGSGGELELHSGPVAIQSGEAARLEVRIPDVHPVEIRSASPRQELRRDRLVVRGEGLRVYVRPTPRTERIYLPPGSYEIVAESLRDRTDGPALATFQVPDVTSIEIPGEDDR